MKKPLLILTALLCACVLSRSSALAEGEIVRLLVGTAEGEAGGAVEIPVLLSNCAGVDSAQFDLNYDPAALSVVSVTPGDLFPAEYCVANYDEAGRIRVACAIGPGLSASGGTILTVTFNVLGETGSALIITAPKGGAHTDEVISRVDADYRASFAYVSLENGGVRVGAAGVPAPLVTPWLPATPTPTPSPTPDLTPSPEPVSQQPSGGSAAPGNSKSAAAGPISYVVVGVLTLALAALIVFTVLNRRRAGPLAPREEDENRGES